MDFINWISIIIIINWSNGKRLSLKDNDIEKVFYYKDTFRKTQPAPPPQPPPTQAPNYCQSSCCFCFPCNKCDNPNEPLRSLPAPPKPVLNNMLPLNFRRSGSIDKEYIKNLISQDEDIKKILKDLVRVTMQKINVLEIYKGSKNADNNENSYED